MRTVAFLFVLLLIQSAFAAPAITNVSVDMVTKTTARINWYTDVPATTRIHFGETTSYDPIYVVKRMG